MGFALLIESGPEKPETYEYHWANDVLVAHMLSDVGKKRHRNEDRCMLCAPEDRVVARERGVMFAIADGMGGVTGGEFASKTALQTIAEEYFNGSGDTIPKRLQEAVAKASRRIYEEAENHPEYYGMGTTVSALVLKGDHGYVAQVGDSRVYVVQREEHIWQITDDHSLVAEQLRNGIINEQEARSHSLKNLITRAVGTKDFVKADLFVFRLREDDTILICSDGLSNMVDDAQIAAALDMDNLQGAARVLVGRALEAGAPDNVSVIAIRLTGVPPKTEPEEGATKVTLSKAGFFGRLKRWVR